MSQRVLLLGANGFIGRHLLDALARSDWATPVAAVRRATAAAPGVDYLRLDATDAGQLGSALTGIDVVINCVAGSAATMTAGAHALWQAAGAQPRSPRLLHMSSMAVYGAATGRVDETAPLLAQDPYGRGKIDCEAVLAAWPAGCVVFRPGIVYGPGSRQWSIRIARWLEARRIGDLGAAGDGICNLVFVGDVVEALCAAVRSTSADGKVLNLAMPAAPTWNEYFISFARALRAVPVARISRRRLKLETKLLAPPLKIAELLGQRAGLQPGRLPEPIPPSLLRLFQQDMTLDASLAQQLLQLRWTSLADGLEASARALAVPGTRSTRGPGTA